MANTPKIFPNLMVQMVAAGNSGGLDKAFSRVGSQVRKRSHLKGLIIKSAIYPDALIVVVAITTIVLNLYFPV